MESPAIGCSTFGSAERMRVPWPAARITISRDMTGYQSWVVSNCDRVVKIGKEKRVAEATLFYQSHNKWLTD
jgi:hypothetical protein